MPEALNSTTVWRESPSDASVSSYNYTAVTDICSWILLRSLISLMGKNFTIMSKNNSSGQWKKNGMCSNFIHPLTLFKIFYVCIIFSFGLAKAKMFVM